MKRLEVEERAVVVISATDLESDWKRGYAVLEFSPESFQVRRNPLNGQEIRVKVEAVPNYCCMKCQFATTIKDHLMEHLFHGNHPWEFGPFKSPYGNTAYVTVEGVSNFDEFVLSRAGSSS